MLTHPCMTGAHSYCGVAGRCECDCHGAYAPAPFPPPVQTSPDPLPHDHQQPAPRPAGPPTLVEGDTLVELWCVCPRIPQAHYYLPEHGCPRRDPMLTT